jgi:hypothetical protein
VTHPLGDRPLLWPQALVQPSRPPRLVYLDLNHWIYLAQAAVGHVQGAAYRQALEACRAAKSTGAALFPLSAAHYIEMYNIKDPRQRLDVAAVMEELSGFATIVSRSVVMVAEVRQVLDALARKEASTDAVNLMGFGVGPAFGMRGGLRMRDADGRDVTQELSPKRMAALASAEWQLERALLAGPPDEEVPTLVEQGYDPRAAIKVAQQRAQQEEDLRLMLDDDPRWRRGRLRDVVSARELRYELLDIVEAALGRRGLAWADVLGDRESLRRFMGAMPSTEVAVALKTNRHRNAALRWTANDINDIDALSLAVPYCDVVVTEKFAHHVITTSRVAERMNTVVLRRISDLSHLLV